MNAAVLTSIENKAGPALMPLTVQQYHAMMTAGILTEGAPIELIGGLLVRKDRRDSKGGIMTVGPRHAMVLTLLGQEIDRLLSAVEFHSRQQQPVTLSGVDEPEPDISIVAGGPARYGDRHPGPADIRLAVEIADSSLKYDRDEKSAMYAAAGIPQYWIVNLKEDTVEVFENPLTSGSRYVDRRANTSKQKQKLSFVLDGQTFEIDLTNVF